MKVFSDLIVSANAPKGTVTTTTSAFDAAS
jgi:hypothetical protein